ncbi:MAG: hypothetical protein HY072_03995 [Deltaproteobacteria bacterium]|nr:hypothetical protein [Deltaproteobacteria bacterium]
MLFSKKTFIGIIIFLVLPHLSFSEMKYWGHSDYKLIFVNPPDPNFDPNEDLINPSARFKAQEELREAILKATTNALMPLSSVLSGNLTAANNSNLFENVLGFASVLKHGLKPELEKLLANNKNLVLPAYHETFLAPFDNDLNFYYSKNKITFRDSGSLNILEVDPTSNAFSNLPKEGEVKKKLNLSQNIIDLNKTLYQRHKALQSIKKPLVYLLALRTFLSIENLNKTELTLRILLAIPPLTQALDKDSPEVKIHRVVVPDLGDHFPIASLKVTFNLSSPNDNPIMSVQLGDFKMYERPTYNEETQKEVLYTKAFREAGDFATLPDNIVDTAPRLQANPKFRGKLIEQVALDFNFSEITMDLKKQEINGLKIYTAPGLKVGKTAYMLHKGFRISKVEGSFSAELNKTIQEQIQTLEKKRNEIATSLSALNLTEVINKILGNAKP